MEKVENQIVSKGLLFIKGVAISFIITIILFYILGIILTYTSMPEKIITPAIIIITGVSILIGTSISLIKTDKKGMIKGGLIGITYFFIIYMISSMLLKNFEINVYSGIMFFSTFVCGCVGGIVGVNMKN